MATTTGWFRSTNTGAVGNNQSLNNSSGFNAYPNGIRAIDGLFDSEGYSVCFYSATEYATNDSWSRVLTLHVNLLVRTTFLKKHALSVRFVRD